MMKAIKHIVSKLNSDEFRQYMIDDPAFVPEPEPEPEPQQELVTAGFAERMDLVERGLEGAAKVIFETAERVSDLEQTDILNRLLASEALLESMSARIGELEFAEKRSKQQAAALSKRIKRLNDTQGQNQRRLRASLNELRDEVGLKFKQIFGATSHPTNTAETSTK